MDQAITRAVDASQEAIRQLVSTGRGLSDNELKQAIAGLQKIEEDFINTVSEVAESASDRVRPDLKEAVSKATRSGTETGRKTAAAMTEFTRSLAGTSVELTLAGMELASALGLRFAKIASGVLAGTADALDKAASETKKNS
jgi:ATP phosphoribosyltransferase